MITINHAKAKDAAHSMRRAFRTAEFAPHDFIISRQIPDLNSQNAEQERQRIREKYAQLQREIDESPDVASLQSIVYKMKGQL